MGEASKKEDRNGLKKDSGNNFGEEIAIIDAVQCVSEESGA